MFEPEFLGWKKYALKGVNIHDVPGAHHLIFTPPNGSELGQLLQYCLDKAVEENKRNPAIVDSAISLQEQESNLTSKF